LPHGKGDKVHLFNVNFTDDDVDDEYSMKNKTINEFGLNGYNVITKLMEKLEKRKATLDTHEDLLILEKERNLELQGLISNKDEMLEVLTKEMSSVKVTTKDKENEISCAKTSIVNLENAKEALESSI
jgi:chromosome segregation ATPase